MSVEARGARAAVAQAGFETFYRRERDALYRALALTLGDGDLAVEAVDEGMTRAYQRWGRVGRYRNPAGWVYRVALTWAISRRRRRRRSVPVGEVRAAGAAAVHHDPPPGDEELAGALTTLPARQRAVLVLRFHLDWSLEQIASALDVPEGTVKSRLHRGLAALREQMEAAP